MFTKLGSKSLAANNYRINEDPENNSRGYCCEYMHVKCDFSQQCASEYIQAYYQCSLTGLECIKCHGGLTSLCQSINSIYVGTTC